MIRDLDWVKYIKDEESKVLVKKQDLKERVIFISYLMKDMRFFRTLIG